MVSWSSVDEPRGALHLPSRRGQATPCSPPHGPWQVKFEQQGAYDMHNLASGRAGAQELCRQDSSQSQLAAAYDNGMRPRAVGSFARCTCTQENMLQQSSAWRLGQTYKAQPLFKDLAAHAWEAKSAKLITQGLGRLCATRLCQLDERTATTILPSSTGQRAVKIKA